MPSNFVYLNEDNSLTNLTDFDLSVNKLTVEKNTKLNQNLNVIGNTIINQNLNVSNSIITPNLIVLKNFTVPKSNNGLNIQPNIGNIYYNTSSYLFEGFGGEEGKQCWSSLGGINQNEDIIIKHNLTVEKNINVKNNLNISGISTFKQNVNIESNLNVTNNLNVTGNLNISEKIYIKGTELSTSIPTVSNILNLISINPSPQTGDIKLVLDPLTLWIYIPQVETHYKWLKLSTLTYPTVSTHISVDSPYGNINNTSITLRSYHISLLNLNSYYINILI